MRGGGSKYRAINIRCVLYVKTVKEKESTGSDGEGGGKEQRNTVPAIGFFTVCRAVLYYDEKGKSTLQGRRRDLECKGQ